MNLLHQRKFKNLFAKYGVSFAYLFGSRVGKKTVKSSDFDIAVFLDAPSNENRFAIRLKLQQELQEIFAPVKVDLVVLNDIRSITLRYAIIHEGGCIYNQKPQTRINFEFRTLREYEDFLPFLQAYNQKYLHEIA